MALTKVEILVMALEAADAAKTQRYDIITIQPFGHPWGRGDLTGRLVFVVELDLPCGEDFMAKKRCGQCEHFGIEWDSKTPTVGTTGKPKAVCEMRKFNNPYADEVLSFDMHGLPEVKETLHHKNIGQADYSKLTTISTDTTAVIEKETGTELIPDAVLALRLENARKEKNWIKKEDLTLKSDG